jgi:site-specific DNA-cytosine methylase
MEMKVIIACEFSGIVRDAFLARGHDAFSCDILPTESNSKRHFQEDIFEVIKREKFDLMIAHPPCTYLTVTGNKWMKPEFANRFPDRSQQRQDAIDFFLRLANAPIDKIAIENPVGVMSTNWRKPDQYIHPYQFGDPHSKKTGLWLKNLPSLKPTKLVEPQFYIYKDGRKDPIWHFESMNLPAQERMKFRSKTFQGIADAMANQWS